MLVDGHIQVRSPGFQFRKQILNESRATEFDDFMNPSAAAVAEMVPVALIDVMVQDDVARDQDPLLAFA